MYLYIPMQKTLNKEDFKVAFWDNLGQKASETTAKAVQKAKDLSDVAKYNSMISEEETKINNTYYQIGKLYLAVHGNDPEPDFAGFVSSIVESNQKIETYKQQILDIRGVQRCPKCGAEIQLGVAFCSACGAPVPHEKPAVAEDLIKCSNCGSMVKKGVRFCTACGNPMTYPATAPAPAQEAAPTPEATPAPTFEMPPIPEQPAPAVDGKVCPQCGAAVDESLSFCTNCGAKL